MKKRILISLFGAAAGLLYAVKATRQKQDGKTDAPKHKSKDSELAARSNGASVHAASKRGTQNGKAVLVEEKAQPAIDDKGTDQIEASQILKNIRDNGFDASDEKLALALGRPTEEIEEWTSGNGSIDGDVIMKARGLAIQRGLDAE